jgi:hypothetical protein
MSADVHVDQRPGRQKPYAPPAGVYTVATPRRDGVACVGRVAAILAGR